MNRYSTQSQQGRRRLVWRSTYNKAIAQGLSHQEASRKADKATKDVR